MRAGLGWMLQFAGLVVVGSALPGLLPATPRLEVVTAANGRGPFLLGHWLAKGG